MKYANVEELKKALVHYADQVDETHTLALVLERTVESVEDVVDIVRCKDCKHFGRSWCLCEEMPICGDDATTFEPDEDFWCKYGERRGAE